MINWQTYELGEVISNVIDNRGRNPPSYKDVGVPVIDNFMIKDKKSIDLSETRRFIDNKTFNIRANYFLRLEVRICPPVSVKSISTKIR